MITKTAKIIFLAVCLLFYGGMFFNAASAADITLSLTFEWEQAPTDLPNLSNWKLHWGDLEAGPFTPVVGADGAELTVPYTGTPAPTYQMTHPFIVTLPAGATVTKYFVMTAIDTDGNPSDYSNVATNPDGSVGVPFRAPLGAPFSMSVEAVIVTP
jgi:hypothetical protein